MHIDNGTYNYAMSILKSNNGNPDACNRYTFAYENPVAGEAHFIHTYMGDGNPLPSFEGEPKLVGWKETLIPLPVWYGKILMRRTKFPYLYVTLTLKPENTRQEL